MFEFRLKCHRYIVLIGPKGPITQYISIGLDIIILNNDG